MKVGEKEKESKKPKSESKEKKREMMKPEDTSKIKEEKKPEKKSKKMEVQCEYFDQGNHWCKLCNAVSGNLFDMFQHLHSNKHDKVSYTLVQYPENLSPEIIYIFKSNSFSFELVFWANWFNKLLIFEN